MFQLTGLSTMTVNSTGASSQVCVYTPVSCSVGCAHAIRDFEAAVNRQRNKEIFGIHDGAGFREVLGLSLCVFSLHKMEVSLWLL